MDKVGVAVGLATIGMVGAAFLLSLEHARTEPMSFIERHLGLSPNGGATSKFLALHYIEPVW
jgi:hypothetical protein